MSKRKIPRNRKVSGVFLYSKKRYLKAWKLMERKLLDMTNRLFISRCNSRVEYGDKFKLKSGENKNY